MGGIYIDMEAFHARMVADIGEMFGPLGLAFFGAAMEAMKPRQSFWQKLKNEIANRPKVF